MSCPGSPAIDRNRSHAPERVAEKGLTTVPVYTITGIDKVESIIVISICFLPDGTSVCAPEELCVPSTISFESKNRITRRLDCAEIATVEWSFDLFPIDIDPAISFEESGIRYISE